MDKSDAKDKQFICGFNVVRNWYNNKVLKIKDEEEDLPEGVKCFEATYYQLGMKITNKKELAYIRAKFK